MSNYFVKKKTTICFSYLTNTYLSKGFCWEILMEYYEFLELLGSLYCMCIHIFILITLLLSFYSDGSIECQTKHNIKTRWLKPDQTMDLCMHGVCSNWKRLQTTSGDKRRRTLVRAWIESRCIPVRGTVYTNSYSVFNVYI